MTRKEFVAWSVGYYGPWPKGQQDDVAQYLGKLSPSYMDALRDTLVKTFSSQYGKAPDIAAFEAAKREAIDLHEYRMPNVPRLTYTETTDSGELMQIDWVDVFWDTVGQGKIEREDTDGK